MNIEVVEQIQLGFILYKNFTSLDLVGPWEALSRTPNSACHLISQDLEPVRSASAGLSIIPTATFTSCPKLDLLCVPGGPGHLAAMENESILSFLKTQASTCRYLTSVCTGSLVLAAAGLLTGYKATTHWTSLSRLEMFGIEAVSDRVVVDRNRITGGGVTAGIDFGLALLTEISGEVIARRVQLQIEYDPEPPFSGSPDKALRDIVEAERSSFANFYEKINKIDSRASARLSVRV